MRCISGCIRGCISVCASEGIRHLKVVVQVSAKLLVRLNPLAEGIGRWSTNDERGRRYDDDRVSSDSMQVLNLQDVVCCESRVCG